MLLNSPLKGLLIYTHTIAISESLFLQSWTYYDFLKLYVQAINILDSELFFFGSHHTAYGILVLQLGIEAGPSAVKEPKAIPQNYFLIQELLTVPFCCGNH